MKTRSAGSVREQLGSETADILRPVRFVCPWSDSVVPLPTRDATDRSVIGAHRPRLLRAADRDRPRGRQSRTGGRRTGHDHRAIRQAVAITVQRRNSGCQTAFTRRQKTKTHLVRTWFDFLKTCFVRSRRSNDQIGTNPVDLAAQIVFDIAGDIQCFGVCRDALRLRDRYTSYHILKLGDGMGSDTQLP